MKEWTSTLVNLCVAPRSMPRAHPSERRPNHLVLPENTPNLFLSTPTFLSPVQSLIRPAAPTSNPRPQPPCPVHVSCQRVGIASHLNHDRWRSGSRRWLAIQGCLPCVRCNTQPSRIWLWRPRPCSCGQVPACIALVYSSASPRQCRGQTC
jgi:hypothetical protein